MGKIMTNKIKLALVMLLVAIATIVFGTFIFASASEYYLSDVALEMEANSAVLVEGDDGVNGIIFTAKLSDADYDYLSSQVGEGKAYAQMETGVIIVPSYYNDEIEINQNSLFGESAVYDWAVYKNGAYSYEGSKIRVININANTWQNCDGYRIYTGGIVDVLETNETETFFATAYIKLTDTSGTDYFIFATSSVTDTVVAAASRAINAGTLTQAQTAWVKENWLDEQGVNDTVEYLVDVKDKTVYDITDAVYDKTAKSLIAAYGKENLSYKLTDANGVVKTERILDVTDESNLRLWNIEISIGDTVLYTGKADLYNSTQSAVWNVLSTTSGVENAVLIRNETEKIDGKMQTVNSADTITTEDGKTVIKSANVVSSFYYTVLPVHSKSYYERYQDDDYTFSYSWKYKSSVAFNAGAQGFYFLNGKSWDGTNKADTWYSNSITLKQIVDNWDNFTNFETREWATRYNSSMFCTYNLLSAAGTVDVYVNFSLVDNAAVNTLADLNGINDKTCVSLSDVMNTGVYNSIVNSYPAAVWYLVDAIKDTETQITDITNVDLTAFAKKAYLLKVVDDGATVFEADFDIYDSTDDVVWNTVSNETIDYVKTYQFINANNGDGELSNNVSVTEDGFFKAVSNEFYYYFDGTTTVSPLEYFSVTVLPLHSKSYYQQYYGEGLIVRMRMVKEGLLDYSTVQFMDENYHNYWSTTYGEITIKLDLLIDKWNTYNGTGMTTNTDSWTVMTRASGNVENQNQQFIISLGEITLTQPATTNEGIGSLKGKQVSVIGDSISTWNYNNDGATYPHVSNNETNKQNITKSDTWWQQVIDNYGMELVENKATSGATAGHGVLMSGTPTSNSKLNVAATAGSLSKQGVDPDVVLLYIGMNDMCRGSTVIKEGDDIYSEAFYDAIPSLYNEFQNNYEANKSDYGMALSQSLGLDTYARAYAYILYCIKKNYPNADIICVNLPEKVSTASQYNEVINTVAAYYNLPVVDLNTAFKTAGGLYADATYCFDGLHPNANGFDIMSNAVIAKMNEIYGAK